MAKVIFSSDLQRFTNGSREVELAAGNYQSMVAELCERFPSLTAAILGKYAIAVNGMVIQMPMLEKFSPDSEIVLVAKIAGG